jgi:hypothetical protein
MVMRRLLLVMAILSAAMLGTVEDASGKTIRECGNISGVRGSPAGVDNLTTRNVSCRFARHFAVQVTERDPMPHRWDGFVCRDNPIHQGLDFDMRCVKRNHIIRWQGGD